MTAPIFPTTDVLPATNGRFDTEVLHRHWIPLARDDEETAAVLRERLGVDFVAAGNRLWETDDFLYFPVVANYRRADGVERETIVFALGGEFLVTLQPTDHFAPFDKAVAKMRRNRTLTDSPHGVMYALLWSLNAAAERAVQHAGAALAAVDVEIDTATKGSELRTIMGRMNAAEQTVAHTQQTQLHLARAARHLAAELPFHTRELADPIAVLVADIDGVRQLAAAAHEKLRYLQHTVTTWLDIEQNQILKVFTIVTAVFLPPTLIATVCGMNFTHIPETHWEYGFSATILMLLAAVIPLVYLKRKGWLR
ncbi:MULTISPECIES: magnesium transporter CorA family protein [unclassified Nocardia]|uniref:magnesium transporter CorA family protein n=1 Tax=unclassified Nocardia TaxID=2637762 RepID=UPI001CE47BBD|nr:MULTISPECIES: CorA family divalent cation transporter [unclassified Nocardia]